MSDPISLKADQKLVKTGPARIGGLAVSRALGDHLCKKIEPSIIAIPEVVEVPVCDGDYLILACDGLWDVMSSLEVAAFVKERLTWPLEEIQKECSLNQPLSDEKFQETGSNEHLRCIACSLRNKAYALQSEDNISVMIVKL